MQRRSFLSHSALLGAVPAEPSAPASTGLEARLVEAFDALEIVDSHEHLVPEHGRVGQPVDFFTLAGHYAMNDVTSAGLPAESLARINNAETPLAERWRLFEPHWKLARFTGYGQALRTAIHDIYGVEEISAATIEGINKAIEARNKPGLYRYVMKERARIRYAVVDDNFNAMPRPATLLVTGDRISVIRRAETQEDVFRRDEIPEHLETVKGKTVSL